MYDEYAQRLIELIPDLPEIDRDACRRALSAAYFHVVRSQLAISQDAISRQDLEEIQLLLRGMGDALESIAVFDRLNGLNRPADVENASAFVAAEALFLLAALSADVEEPSVKDPLLKTSNYVAIESALLYMIGGYDINAVSIVRDLEVPAVDLEGAVGIDGARLANAAYVLSRIIALCCGEVRQPRQSGPVRLPQADRGPTDYELLLDEIRIRFYERVGDALDAYLDWLGGYRSDGYENSIRILESVRNVSLASGYPGYTAFADIHHLSSLLLVVIDRTSRRSLIYNIPRPTDGDAEVIQDFVTYLRYRARGDETRGGRPFLWPSTLEYASDCLPGPSKDAVVAMPTGSGKSFVAELAATHALCSGWVLYLAPTNALAHQIRRDLTHALRPFQQVEVRAFVGWEEYTTLTEEQINLAERHFVAVMTPEKCALAMRLYPERFTNCSLCVFDECHLLNDQQRGVTADILLAQLSMGAPNIRFVLMSAMVSNPEELAEWLSSAHDGRAAPKTVRWRPSRTMRGLLFLDQNALDANFQPAKTELEQLPEQRVSIKFNVPMALIAGLSGPWTMAGPPDYRVTRLPIDFEAKAARRRGGRRVSKQFDSWKNTASRQVSELLARSGMSVLCFILASRHHAFSGAHKVSGVMPGSLGATESFPSLVEAWLKIADAELGVETTLRDLLRRGIAVHTSAMLQPEQAASEWMFAKRKALLMFATGTLAQGLNLPAIAVVIAGTSMGDPRQTDPVAGITRANALILNGFGRAGRPGFSNQGIAILVSDTPFWAPVVEQLNPRRALEQYDVLGEPDAAVEVHSPIEGFLDFMLEENPEVLGATKTELTLTSLLAEYDKEDYNASQILSRTLAAYHNRQRLSHQVMEQIRQRITDLKNDFLQQPDVPDWMNRAAMKAGVSFWRAWRMWMAYQQSGLISVETGATFEVTDWVDVFFEVMSLLPPKQVRLYLADESLKRLTVLTKLRDHVRGKEDVDTIPWETPQGWSALWQQLKRLVLMYMQGVTYAEMARVYLGLPDEEQITNKRSSGSHHPIPIIFGFLRKVVHPLAIDAGCFLAIQEFALYGEGDDIPETLQALPLCIRNGCDSLGSLSWYRFVYRQRICAHALEAAFPVPKDLKDDGERAKWVRQTREEWLSGRLMAEAYPILGYAMTVIKEGGAM